MIEGMYAAPKITRKYVGSQYARKIKIRKRIPTQDFQYCKYLIIHDCLFGYCICLEIRNQAYQ
jgi:hypothetical protein